ncbi:MAG: conjugal transfer protein TraX [bacterium]|nr:conjugal transfer protein TraX [bacterium]
MDGMQSGTLPYQTSAQKKGGLSGSTVKIIAVAAMLIDHIAAAVLMRMLIVRGMYSLPNDGNQVLRWLLQNAGLYYGMQAMRTVGRLGFPIFCFLLVEGFQKTRNLKKYIFRLGLFALISEIPFDLAFSGCVLEGGYQNVYFTLFLGILALAAFDFIAKWNPGKGVRILLTAAGILLTSLACALCGWFLVLYWFFEPDRSSFLIVWGASLTAVLVFYLICRRKKGGDKAWRMCACLTALMLLMAAAELLRTDYGGMGVFTIAAMYLFRKNKVKSMLAGCIALNLLCLIEANTSELAAFFALLPVAFYNGERGWKLKYFFYAFYPVHLLAVWLIAAAMGMGWISAI